MARMKTEKDADCRMLHFTDGDNQTIYWTAALPNQRLSKRRGMIFRLRRQEFFDMIRHVPTPIRNQQFENVAPKMKPIIFLSGQPPEPEPVVNYKSKVRLLTTTVLGVALGLSVFSDTVSAQAPAKVDFAKDVQPVLQDNCVDCHGPTKQKAGMRLDRKSSALKAFSRRVVPGSSANSMVFLRIAGHEYGMQMPPKGPLHTEEIATLKAWIDQGADWPDSLANEVELPPLNPQALAMVESLHNGDMASFMKAAQANPALLNARGPEGSTPFMYAVLYSDAATVAKLLKLGADPNKHNDANGTALMWAARDLQKTRLLVKHGADVNAKSDGHRTPLMIAARRPGAAPIVKFLLDHGASPNPNGKAVMSPLTEALTGGDEKIVKLLIDRGADAKATGDLGLAMAITTGCDKGLEMLAAGITNKASFTGALQDAAAIADLKAVRLMLDHGADVNAFDPVGKTPLMYAVISDTLPVDVVKLMIERGADVNAIDKRPNGGDTGLTVLDIAKLNGNTPVVDLLVKSGAKASPQTPETPQPRRGNTLRRAVQDSVPLLQRADFNFAKNAGCISCHNNSMEAMAVATARKRGIRIDEQTASAEVRVNVDQLVASRDHMHEGYVVPVADYFSDFILGYQLVGLAAENYPPDINTDAAAMLIQSRQKANGEWPYPHADTRPPLCLDYVTQTALAMRALQLYAPKTHRAAFEKSIRLAASWLANAKSSNNDDRTWRLTGLVWAGTDRAATKQAMQEVLAAQRLDGGWSDLPSMGSTAYATGRSLVSLQMAGLPVSDPAYQRGIKFLLDTQQEDGSWHIRTRALAFQPYFDAGYPHGFDQWISAAGSSWATMALALALPETGPSTAPLSGNRLLGVAH
jgi:ankyrin repeat protein